MSDQLIKQLIDEITKLSKVLQDQNQRIDRLEGELHLSKLKTKVPSVSDNVVHPEQADSSKESFKTAVLEKAHDVVHTVQEKKDATAEAVRQARLNKPKEDMESKFGAKYLNRIGIVVLVLAFVFFLKYSFDNNYIGETGRIMIGILAGLGLVGIGEYFHKKYATWSKSFVGGGMALLYFSIFAARNFYSLISSEATFFFTILVTILGCVFAVRYNSKIIAVFAFLGGFISPALIGSISANYVSLLTYILILNMGILLLNNFKNWKDLNFVAFIGTAIYSFTLHDMRLGTALMFLIVFYLLFAMLAVVYNFIYKKKTDMVDALLVVLNSVFLFLNMYGLLYKDYENWIGVVALVIAVLYLAQAYAAFSRSKKDPYLIMIFLGLTTTFVTVALAYLLEQNWITLGWLAEALVLFWIGFKMKHESTRKFASVILILALFRLFVFDSDISMRDFTLFANERTVSYLATIFSIYLLSYWYHKYRGILPNKETKLATWLAIFANILTIFFITIELNDHYRSMRYNIRDYSLSRSYRQMAQVAISIAWAVYAIILIIVGIIKRFKPIRLLALVLFSITIFKVAFIDLHGMKTIYRIIAFFFLGVILIFASYLYQRFKDNIKEFVLAEDDHKPDQPAATEDQEIDLNAELAKIDIGNDSKVTFLLRDSKPFSTTEPSIIKIVRYVEKKYGRDEFEPDELKSIYDLFIKYYTPTLPEEKLVIAVEKLHSFVTSGGSFRVN